MYLQIKKKSFEFVEMLIFLFDKEFLSVQTKFKGAKICVLTRKSKQTIFCRCELRLKNDKILKNNVLF